MLSPELILTHEVQLSCSAVSYRSDFILFLQHIYMILYFLYAGSRRMNSDGVLKMWRTTLRLFNLWLMDSQLYLKLRNWPHYSHFSYLHTVLHTSSPWNLLSMLFLQAHLHASFSLAFQLLYPILLTINLFWSSFDHFQSLDVI